MTLTPPGNSMQGPNPGAVIENFTGAHLASACHLVMNVSEDSNLDGSTWYSLDISVGNTKPIGYYFMFLGIDILYFNPSGGVD